MREYPIARYYTQGSNDSPEAQKARRLPGSNKQEPISYWAVQLGVPGTVLKLFVEPIANYRTGKFGRHTDFYALGFIQKGTVSLLKRFATGKPDVSAAQVHAQLASDLDAWQTMMERE
jgi:hypothetical protein